LVAVAYAWAVRVQAAPWRNMHKLQDTTAGPTATDLNMAVCCQQPSTGGKDDVIWNTKSQTYIAADAGLSYLTI
jgi:hypothetical protein